MKAGLLTRSKYLRFVESGAETWAYHSLFGNLARLDRELSDFLSKMSVPVSKRELETRLGKEILESLVETHFVSSAQSDERQVVEDWLQDRAARIHTGTYVQALQISSSNTCNFACSYCFADSSDLRSPVRRKNAGQPNISEDVAKRAIDEVRALARKNKHPLVAVKFLGREPLVNWKVIRALLEGYPEGVKWSLTTNGSLLNDEIARRLAAHSVQTVVSLDGLKKTNDSNRTYHNGKGTFDRVTSKLRLLHSHGLRFGISSVVSRATDFDEMRSFIDKVVEFGASELELTLVMQVDANLIRPTSMSTTKSFVAELVSLYNYGTSKGLFIHGDWVQPFLRLQATHKLRSERNISRPVGNGCSATSHQISLEPSGDLFPCRAMSLHYGHLDDLGSVLGSDAYKKVVMRTYYNVAYCHGCSLEGFCQGGCLGSAEEATEDIYRPQREYCDIYRMATSQLLSQLSLSESIYAS